MVLCVASVFKMCVCVLNSQHGYITTSLVVKYLSIRVLLHSVLGTPTLSTSTMKNSRVVREQVSQQSAWQQKNSGSNHKEERSAQHRGKRKSLFLHPPSPPTHRKQIPAPHLRKKSGQSPVCVREKRKILATILNFGTEQQKQNQDFQNSFQSRFGDHALSAKKNIVLKSKHDTMANNRPPRHTREVISEELQNKMILTSCCRPPN